MWQSISIWLGIFIMGICEILFAKIILKEEIKVSKYSLLAILLITSIIYTFNNIYVTGIVKTAIVYIIHVVTFKYIFQINLSKSIFLTFIYVAFLIIIDIFQLLVATKIIGMSKEDCYNIFAGSILGNTLTSLIFLGITYIVRKPLRKIVSAKIENNNQIVIFSILICVCIFMFFHKLAKEFRINNNIIMYLIAIIVLLIVLFSLIKQVIENKKITSRYDKLLEFMTTYELEIENQKTLRHETKNEFLTIRGKIHDKQAEREIIAYIDEILKEKIEIKQEEYAKFGYLPANGIKGLCYLKIQEAQDKGLITNISISERVSTSNIVDLNIKQQRNLGKLLGVFLDNAIEAALNSDVKRVGIEAYLNMKKECMLIISNSYVGELDIEKMGKEKFSTKGKNRGHGLLLVNHILNKSNKFEVKTEIGNDIYVQKIIIKNEEEKISEEPE